MATQKCTYPGCEGKFYGRGLCNKHYQKEWKAGRLAPKTLEQRFHEKYRKCPHTGCWLWTASTRRGYGHMGAKETKNTLAHRISWELHNGLIPDGLHVLHNCPSGDNPSCVNPEHLFLGTHEDNMADMAKKGRAKSVNLRGSAHPNSKLTEELALEIFHAEGRQVEIAARYGVAFSLVSAIKRKQSWKHIHG